MPRTIDHLVLPVASLEGARARYEALGFQVNADGIHPFGTANCCIFMENGTYLEPLAVHDPALVEKNRKTNGFVAFNERFRSHCATEGFSGIALSTDDAQADEAAFREAGLAGPSMLSFSRKALHPDGSEDVLTVDGAFCLHSGFPAFSLFTCRWLGDPEAVRRIKKPGRHRNRITGVVGVSLVADDPSAVLPYLTLAFGSPFEARENGIHFLCLPNGTVTLSAPTESRFFHHEGRKDAARALQAAAFTLASADIAATRAALAASRIPFREEEGLLVIPPAEGQGTTLLVQDEGKNR